MAAAWGKANANHSTTEDKQNFSVASVSSVVQLLSQEMQEGPRDNKSENFTKFFRE